MLDQEYVMSRTQALKQEIQSSLGSGPNPRGKSILRSVTDLFINRVDEYSNEQMDVFGDVMHCLLDYTEHDARIELSGRLSAAPRAPAKIVRTLLKDKDPAVAAPVLSHLSSMSESDLVEIAKDGSLEQAMVMAKRPSITRLVTDALLARKSAAVTYVVLSNETAEFSETGFVTLIGECTNDAQISTLLAARKDLPPELKPFLDAYTQQGKAQKARYKGRR